MATVSKFDATLNDLRAEEKRLAPFADSKEVDPRDRARARLDLLLVRSSILILEGMGAGKPASSADKPKGSAR